MSPKLFISYSWTNENHQSAVLQLATELRESGIDVILDKWDLKEGHDAHAFMERMVSDPEVMKVLIVCDKVYAEKADGRMGGVGTETQIITPDVYGKQEQSKFVAVVMERNEDGTPCLPTYYRSRIYFDLSDAASYATEFEKIVRWVFNEPLHKKPAIGEKPGFLTENERVVQLGTSARFKRAIDAIRNSREYAVPAVEEYFSLLSEQVEQLRLQEKADPFDDQVIDIINDFVPYRDETISMFNTIAIYSDVEENRRSVHRFFERLLVYYSRPESVTSWQEWDFDYFKFVIHELYMYAIATFIKHERFHSAESLMGDYYIRGRSDLGRDVMVPYSAFRDYLRSLDHRNNRLQLKRLSLHADLLKQRCKGVPISFIELMQADFVLFIRSCIHSNLHGRWWPETLVYAHNFSGPFEVFARSRSASYFDRAKVLLSINSKQDLGSIIEAFESEPRLVPSWQFNRISPQDMLGYYDLATRP